MSLIIDFYILAEIKEHFNLTKWSFHKG